MTDTRRAEFADLLKAYGRAVFADRSVDDMNAARDAVLAAFDAATAVQGAPTYLANGMRFKLAATRSGAAAEFRSFPAELAGKWVALVDATDDKHLRTHPAPKADAAAVPLAPTPEMIEAGAQRLVSWEDGCVWPDSWDALQVAAARNEAERVWRSMWLAASPARAGETG